MYGDDVGVHRFTFSDNYNKVVKKGGWVALNEFGEEVYVRQ